MIRDHLVPALKQNFPERSFIFNEHPGVIASINLPYGEIGPITIIDDGDEITVSIDHATHGHFGCYDECLGEREKEKMIASDVVDFLRLLFADRVVIFRLLGGWVGGWKTLKPGETPRRSLIWQQFLWSRQIKS